MPRESPQTKASADATSSGGIPRVMLAGVDQRPEISNSTFSSHPLIEYGTVISSILHQPWYPCPVAPIGTTHQEVSGWRNLFARR